jgi:hypothetical protein
VQQRAGDPGAQGPADQELLPGSGPCDQPDLELVDIHALYAHDGGRIQQQVVQFLVVVGVGADALRLITWTICPLAVVTSSPSDVRIRVMRSVIRPQAGEANTNAPRSSNCARTSPLPGCDERPPAVDHGQLALGGQDGHRPPHCHPGHPVQGRHIDLARKPSGHPAHRYLGPEVLGELIRQQYGAVPVDAVGAVCEHAAVIEHGVSWSES